jgi:endonuclease/exonuclease/phosphatase family metal-dependent hydrolase
LSKQKLLALLITAGLPIVLFLPSYSRSTHLSETSSDLDVDCESSLLEVRHAPKGKVATQPAPHIKIVSYNIRWRSGDDLRRLAQLLKEDREIGGAGILGLQEVDRNKKRSGNKNAAEFLAGELGMHYAWAAPPVAAREREEETGVAILSVYPLTDVRRLVLPHKGPGGRRRVALGATIKIGRTAVRVYSIHAETRIPVKRKLEQMEAVINDLAGYGKEVPAIVLGDLNTWEPSASTKTVKLFAAANFHTPFDEQPTFSRRVLFLPIKLKLDWIWLRNLESTSYGIDRTISLSDHWPLWMTVKLGEV